MNKLKSLLIVHGLVLSTFSSSSCGSNKSERVNDNESSYSGAGSISDVIKENDSVINEDVLTALLGHFQFTSSMTEEIIDYIRYDFGTLASWNDSSRASEKAEVAQMFGLTEVNAATLSQWLMDRITYIFPDNGENLKYAFIVPSEKRVYQLSVDTSSGEGVAASNIGGGLYAMYLDQVEQGVGGLLLNFNGTYLNFLSPRTGAMQIGPNFFDSTDSLDVSDSAHRGFRTLKSLYRISVLFHEARHSDGNVKAGTLSFAHINCPDDGSVDDAYVGLPACDDKANGAYNVGAKALAVLQGVCDSICSTRENSIIESIELDMLSRIQVEETAANFGDATPEPNLTPIDTSAYEIIPE